MTVIVITGANKGLGRETARRLAAAGHTVYVGARDPAAGMATAKEIGGRFLHLDVTDDESVHMAARAVGEEAGHLDVLVNNAGIAGAAKEAAELTVDEVRVVFETNTFSAVRTVRAFLPLLRLSETPAVVNVSSGLGSLAITADPEAHTELLPVYFPALAYNASKAALNMLTATYAKACPHIRFNVVDPGWVATDLNGHRGPGTVEAGADIIVRMALADDGPTGGFFGNQGPVPW